MFRKTIKFHRIELPFNPFVPNAPFFYPLKTSENSKVFWCFQRVEKGCTGNEWVKWVKNSLFKLSLRSDFKTRGTSAWPDPYFSKSDIEYLQSELLPAHCHLKTFEICYRKVVLRIFAPLLFKWNLLLFRWFALTFLPWSRRKILFSLQIF